MAILQDIEANFQQKRDGFWTDIEEFDDGNSLKSANHSAHHWTTNVLVNEGLFRFMISLDEAFDWQGQDALLFKLSWHQGLSLMDYPVVALNPSCELPEDKKYDTLGYMAMNPVTKRLEYILESVYTPIAPPEEVFQGYARTTFDFKKVDGVLSNQKTNRKHLPVSVHTIRLSVDFCRVFKTTSRVHRPAVCANENERKIVRQALFPYVDLEPRGVLDVSSRIQRVDGPGYTANKQPVTFNFTYHTQLPADAVQIGDVDIIDKTSNTSLSKVSASRCRTPGRFQSPRRADSQSSNRKHNFVPAADKEETRNGPSSISTSLPSTTDQENINGHDDNSNSDEAEYKPQVEVCTPPLNPTVGDGPVKSVPVLASTSAIVSNFVSDPLPTPTSTPTTARASASRHVRAPNPQHVLEAFLQDHSTLRAARQADILERENDLLEKKSQIETNKKTMEQNETDIRALTVRLAELRSSVNEKNEENETLEGETKKLWNEISEIREEGKGDDVAFEDAKKAYEVLRSRVKKTNRHKRRRSQVSLGSSPYSGGRRTRDCSSTAMQTDSD